MISYSPQEILDQTSLKWGEWLEMAEDKNTMLNMILAHQISRLSEEIDYLRKVTNVRTERH